MLVQRWSTGGPTLNQHWFNVPCLLGRQRHQGLVLSSSDLLHHGAPASHSSQPCVKNGWFTRSDFRSWKSTLNNHCEYSRKSKIRTLDQLTSLSTRLWLIVLCFIGSKKWLLHRCFEDYRRKKKISFLDLWRALSCDHMWYLERLFHIQ